MLRLLIESSNSFNFCFTWRTNTCDYGCSIRRMVQTPQTFECFNFSLTAMISTVQQTNLARFLGSSHAKVNKCIKKTLVDFMSDFKEIFGSFNSKFSLCDSVRPFLSQDGPHPAHVRESLLCMGVRKECTLHQVSTNSGSSG